MFLKNLLTSAFTVFALTLTAVVQSQGLTPAESDTLKSLSALLQRGPTDSIRIAANTLFRSQVNELLMRDPKISFDSIKNISSLEAPGNTFRLITWALPYYKGEYSYFGFLVSTDVKSKRTQVTALTDSTATILKPEMAKLGPSAWYGAVYYKILANKKKGKIYYTLLGWKGVNTSTTKKVIDVLYFTGNNVSFGYPIFKTGKVYKSRLVFEYQSQAVMSVHYEDNRKMIVLDHLSGGSEHAGTPSVPAGPDGTYDAFIFKNSRWELQSDIDIRTDWKPKKQPKEPQIHQAPVELIK